MNGFMQINSRTWNKFLSKGKTPQFSKASKIIQKYLLNEFSL